MTLKLIVGLGNPGDEYTATRHNAGFWLVERWAEVGNTSFKTEKKFFADIARLPQQDIRLAKPQTFMNQSGRAVAAIANFWRINPAEILVVHDELDLPCGSVRLKKGGGTGGHNGLKDIQAALGSNDFYRLRLGIGHPGDKQAVVGYVLKAPSRIEKTLILDAIDDATTEINHILQGDFEAAMRQLHRKITIPS